MITIEFDAPRPHSFPYTLAEIKEGTPNSFTYVQLQPGMNAQFPPEILEKIKTHPDYVRFTDAGLIKIHNVADIEPKDLQGVPALTSGKLVGDGEPKPVGKAKILG